MGTRKARHVGPMSKGPASKSLGAPRRRPRCSGTTIGAFLMSGEPICPSGNSAQSVRRHRPIGRFESFHEIFELLDIFVTDGALTPAARQLQKLGLGRRVGFARKPAALPMPRGLNKLECGLPAL